MPLIKRWGLPMVVLVSLLVTMGCQSSKPLASGAPPADAKPSASEHERDNTAPAISAVEATLRDAYAAWQGTPHRLGGTSSQGVDCSGFLYVLFPALFNTALPRTTDGQARAGTPVRASDLQPGDLVFFRPARKVRHVGVYLSQGEFLHVPDSGVRVNRLDEPYWRDAFWMSRRVLGDASFVASQPDAPVSQDAPRTGW